MNPSHDNQLDRLLENWADKSAASAKDLAALQQQVAQQLARSSVNMAELPTLSTMPRRLVAVGLAAAAVLLVSVGAWRYHLWQLPADNLPQSPVAMAGYDSMESFQAYWSKHLSQQKQLLMECNQVYGHEVAWVAETEQRCDIGLAATDTGQVVPSEYVVIQLWLVAIHPQESPAKKTHTITMLVGREECVEIPAAIGGGPLVVWAYPIGDGMISIDLHYQPASAVGIEIDSSNLQRIGQVTNIHSFEQNGIEYRLYQTGDVLEDKDLG